MYEGIVSISRHFFSIHSDDGVLFPPPHGRIENNAAD